MPQEPADCLTTLRDAGLDGAVHVCPVLDTAEVGIILEVDAAWFEAWTTVRALVPTTGRWPIAIEDWAMVPPGPFSRHDMDRVPGLDVHPRAILARASSFDLDATLAAEEQRCNDEWRPDHETIGGELEETRLIFGQAPALDHLLAQLGPTPGRLDVERFLFAWENRREPIERWDDTYLKWFPPTKPALVLLPDSDPTCAYAYIGGFEWGHPHPDVRTAALRRWHASFGVEPVANWGTIQQLVVPRPPTDPIAAFQVACEISLLWPDTAGGGNGVSTRRHARDLLGGDRWFLHHRP